MERKIRILFVDDEPHILRTLERFCRNEGFSMLSAHSGGEGLAILESEPVDLVVSDFRMPGMNGLEFIRSARSLRPELKGILLSGYADIPAVTQAVENGDIIALIEKPWEREKLRAAIVAAVAKKKSCPPEGG